MNFYAMSKCHRVQEEDDETLKAMYSNIYRTKSDAKKNRSQKQYDFYQKKVEENLALGVKVFTFGNPSVLQHTTHQGLSQATGKRITINLSRLMRLLIQETAAVH